MNDMPEYLIRAIENAVKYFREGNYVAAQAVLEYVLREVQSGSYKLVQE